jgi:hypothetical protein
MAISRQRGAGVSGWRRTDTVKLLEQWKIGKPEILLVAPCDILRHIVATGVANSDIRHTPTSRRNANAGFSVSFS